MTRCRSSLALLVVAALAAGAGADPLAAELTPVAIERAPVAAPGLRYERVLAPALALLAAPDPSAQVNGAVPSGARVAVDRIQRGWKRVRAADGSSGWIPGDAATPDIGAPERASEQLAPLHALAGPGASASEALCSSLAREQLGELVAAWRIDRQSLYLRPLWHALPAEDRGAFRAWARDCYGVTRLYEAAGGAELPDATLAPRSE